MKIILKEDIPSIGKRGDIVNVSDGYGRNYLIPKKLAFLATTNNIKAFENEKKNKEKKLLKVKKEALNLASKIESFSLTINVKVGEGDKLFGSVTSKDIEERLKKEGINIDKKDIILDEPIKALGVYSIPIRIHSEVHAKLKLWVVKE
jgi:large subunit ribosomal protein L9